MNENIDSISIYGNGLIAKGYLFGTHHVLVTIKTITNNWILLEVERCRNFKINIHMRRSSSEKEVLAQRINSKDVASFWRTAKIETEVNTSKIQEIIEDYHNSNYNLIDKNCRTFVDRIFQNCGSNIRCTTGNPIWLSFW